MMKLQVNTKSQIAMYNLMKICNLHFVLTGQTYEVMVLGLVISCLDYCNGILINIAESTLHQFQRIQSLAVKLVLSRSMFSSTRKALCELNWLLIKE